MRGVYPFASLLSCRRSRQTRSSVVATTGVLRSVFYERLLRLLAIALLQRGLQRPQGIGVGERHRYAAFGERSSESESCERVTSASIASARCRDERHPEHALPEVDRGLPVGPDERDVVATLGLACVCCHAARDESAS